MTQVLMGLSFQCHARHYYHCHQPKEQEGGVGTGGGYPCQGAGLILPSPSTHWNMHENVRFQCVREGPRDEPNVNTSWIWERASSPEAHEGLGVYSKTSLSYPEGIHINWQNRLISCLKQPSPTEIHQIFSFFSFSLQVKLVLSDSP